MRDSHFPLILDLLEWVNRQPRCYTDVMEAWRTSCPHLPVWEDAMDFGYLERKHGAVRGGMVMITGKGQQVLEENNRLP